MDKNENQTINRNAILIEPGSFRDPAGFVFYSGNRVFRAIRQESAHGYNLLMQSGLYKTLVSSDKLISHSPEAVSEKFPGYIVIAPEKIPFISYPYEWCFSQLKAAALLTLHIQQTALKFGMTLKDASAYNIQFRGYRPVFIDTLSFDAYAEDSPWIAYRQFCQHFLAPLAVMHYKGAEFLKLSQLNVDGISLSMAASILPWQSYFNSAIAAHLHAHARIQKTHADGGVAAGPQKAKLTKAKLSAMLQHLEEGIRELELKQSPSVWGNYESEHNYSDEALLKKAEIIEKWLTSLKPASVWDCGCNTGKFSEIAARHSAFVLGLDMDPFCIEYFYRRINGKSAKNILPLSVDFSNPSPSLGWANRERRGIYERDKTEAVMALALVHHLRIAGNVPWSSIAELFMRLLLPGGTLMVEFVKKEDSQVQRLLSSRADIFEDYQLNCFLEQFSAHFEVKETVDIPGAQRVLCLMKAKIN